MTKIEERVRDVEAMLDTICKHFGIEIVYLPEKWEVVEVEKESEDDGETL